MSEVAYERVRLVRDSSRPTGLDYIRNIFKGFIELHGDRRYADDPAIVGGIARLNGNPVTVIAIEKGHTAKELIINVNAAQFFMGQAMPEAGDADNPADENGIVMNGAGVYTENPKATVNLGDALIIACFTGTTKSRSTAAIAPKRLSHAENALSESRRAVSTIPTAISIITPCGFIQ